MLEIDECLKIDLFIQLWTHTNCEIKLNWILEYWRSDTTQIPPFDQSIFSISDKHEICKNNFDFRSFFSTFKTDLDFYIKLSRTFNLELLH